MLTNGKFLTEIIRALIILFILSVIVGLAYPLLMTAVGQAIFPKQVAGSLLYDAKGQVTGSLLIGQVDHAAGDFWGRPSASDDNALNSGGSNLGPTNPQLLKNMQAQAALLQKADPHQTSAIPIDLLTASGSGLDPDISVAAAEYQAPRVAQARHMSLQAVNALIVQNMQPRQWGLLGEPYLNVTQLNQALDQAAS